MEISELGLSVRDFNAVKRFGISTTEELLARLSDFCEHDKGAAGRVTEALHERDLIPYKLGQWLEPVECGEEIQPRKLKAGEFVIMGFPTESRDWRKVVMIRKIEDDTLYYLDGSSGAPHGRLDDRRVWSIRSEKEEDTSMNEDKTTVIVSEDYTRAVTLTRSIIANAQAAQQSLYEVCKGLKEMRDGKLYKELGYQNFEDYTENEVGIKKVQAYNFVAIASNLSADYVQSIEQIGTTKLTLLAKLDEPTREAVTETVDVESVTVKELKAQISALQNEKNRLESENADIGQKLDAATESKNRDLKRISQEKIEISENLRKKSAEFVKAQNRIMSLEKQIKELENRPVEVAVSEDETKEIERLKAELEDTKLRLTQADKNATAKAERAAALVRDEYEEKLANAQRAETDQNALDKEKFEALRVMFEHSCDELECFLEDLEDDPRIDYVANLKSYFRKTIMRLIIPGEGA